LNNINLYLPSPLAARSGLLYFLNAKHANCYITM
jgi:hypothetical protein